MITSMREYFRGLKFILLIVIVAFIATSVVYFGASSVGGPSGTAVASVNGEDIPLDRYRRAYSSYVDFYRQLYRERFTPDLVERLGLPAQVLDELIQDALIVQESWSQGVTVSDEELRRRIREVQAFQQDGQFSRDRYLAVLRQVRLDPGVFEAEQRRDLQRRKLESLVRGGVKVSEAEVRQAWVARHEQVRMAWARVDPRALATEVKVAEEQAEAWLKSHQSQFARPERRRVVYALVASSAFAEPVADAEAEAYYREHPGEFEAPKRVRAAHVLVQVPPTGGRDAESKARAKVEEIIRRAKGGEDFAKLAREASEDQATAGQGGDLGFMKAGDMVKPFEEAAFALGKGEVSPAPVRTSFGYHAIKVLDVREGGREPFKDVGPRIKQRLVAERSEKAARKRAEEVRLPLLAAQDFKTEARKLGLEVREVTMARGDGLEGIGRDPAFEEVVFGLAPGGVSLSVKTSAGFAIVKAVESLPAGVPSLAEIKKEVLEAMRRAEADKLATSRATALIEAVAANGDLVKVARSQGLTSGETPAFSRAEPPKGASADLPGAALVAALQTPVGQVSKPVDTPGGVYVVKPLERRPPDPSGFGAAREELAQTLLNEKRARVWEAFLRGLRGKAKIEMASAATGLPGR